MSKRKFSREFVEPPTFEPQCEGCGENPVCVKCNTGELSGEAVYCDGSGEYHLCEICYKKMKKKNTNGE